MKAITGDSGQTNILLAGLNTFLEKILIAQILVDKNATIGKIIVCHCGQEEIHDRGFDNSYFAFLDEHFGHNRSRDFYSTKVDLVQIQDPVSLNRLMPDILQEVQTVILDSHSQRLREGIEPSAAWFSKNALLLQLIDLIAENKKIKKKFFLNYPFSVYQTRKEDATKDILSAVSLIKKNQPEIFIKKAKQIHGEFKVNLTIFYSSLFQVYLREHYASEFLIIEVPYLVPSVELFRGLYWPQQNVLDDLIIFMRDGIVDKVETPANVTVPIIPVDTCCKLLLGNIENSSAIINNFYCCILKWQGFFYMISDHFTIHSASHAYAGPEVKAIETEKKTSIGLVASRIPHLISRKTKNYSLKAFLKELTLTIKMSRLVDNSMVMLSEETWKLAVDSYIYGVRRYLLNDKTNKIEVYSKYGILRDNYKFRKQSYLHWGLIKGKVQNVNDFNSSYFAERVINCRRLQDAIQEDISLFMNKNPNCTEEDIKNRKKQIEIDILSNLGLLSTHFQKFGLLTLAMGSHYMFRRMFDGIIFDNKFTEFVRNHDYRKGPIIFLPTHKSYMDFMILSYLLVMRDARPPLIGAADNMNNIMLVSKLFKLCGAFYIKRTGQKFPKVYRALLNEYMKSILENEMNMEFFMEATRSRTGQILFPKFGMLKYVVEAYLEKRVPDVILIPLNITYENLIESDSYIGEHRGGQKVAEDTMRFLKAIRLIYRNYGKLIINSSEPFSLKKYLDNYAQMNGGLLLRHVQDDEFIQNLGYHLTNVLQDKSVFMHTHLVCVILLMRHHYQLVKDVETSVKILSAQIKARKGTIFEIEENEFNFDVAIKYFKERLSIRGDTFNERRVCIDRANYIENCMSLKYYANSMNYLFFIEATIYFAASHQNALEKVVYIDVLWQKFSLLHGLFEKEIFLMNWPETKEALLEFMKRKQFISEKEGEIVTELPKEELLVIELYNILIPPIFAGYMVTFIAIYAHKAIGPVEVESFLLKVQNLAETSHNMGVIQSPTFCSMYYMREAYQFLLTKAILVEKPLYRDNRIRKCFVMNNLNALKLILTNCRGWFLWEENYKIIHRVFVEKYLKAMLEDAAESKNSRQGSPDQLHSAQAELSKQKL